MDENRSVVIAENLTLAYKKNEPIIKNASLRINTRDFVFITGKSGSGKSTFLKSLYGAIAPQEGTLNVCGIGLNNVSNSDKNFLRKHLGIVFQDYKLIENWTIEKNIMLPLLIAGFSKDVCIAQAHKLLKHVKLVHKAYKYPLELSGGEQQRAAMARALAHNPVLILADEPTGNLDEYSSSVIWSLLRGANVQLGTTVITVTHKIPSLLRMNYKRFVIDGGHIDEVS
ncbi:MAG: ABC transporter ATP-binding protein [Epsilonproteobacteria bacterium]|nr:ABC transporter ATP-binding protein [Campylobacterota bacterium]